MTIELMDEFLDVMTQREALRKQKEAALAELAAQRAQPIMEEHKSSAASSDDDTARRRLSVNSTDSESDRDSATIPLLPSHLKKE